MPARIALLDDRALLSVAGEDRRTFLQGLVTADVAQMAPGTATAAALLSPQGKILFHFLVVEEPDRFLIDCDLSQAGELLKRFSFYKLRSKVQVERCPDLMVAAVISEPVPAMIEGLVYADPRWPGLGHRIVASHDVLRPLINEPAESYRRARIEAGIPDAAEVGSGSYFPHEVNLDQVGGVSFTKGCYVGQEVVSRMEHRATARSRIVRVSGEALAAGSAIASAGRTIGTVLAAESGFGLALVRLDRFAAAQRSGETALVGGHPVVISRPQGARFALDAPAGEN